MALGRTEETMRGRRDFLRDAALAAATGMFSACRASRDTQPTSRSRDSANLSSANSYLIRGAYVVSMDRDRPNQSAADILIRDGNIVEIAPSTDETGEPDDTGLDVIEAGHMIAMPGFIDTHGHLWNSTLKNMLDERTSYFPLKQAFVPHCRPEDHYAANRMALLEAAHAGITTLNNFAHAAQTPDHVDSELRAMAESGIGGRYS